MKLGDTRSKAMKSIRRIFVCLVLCAGYGSGDFAAIEQGQGAGRGVDVSKLERDARRKGGLREAAKVTGHYRSAVAAEPENNVENIYQLVDWHELIVVGRIVGNRGWLTGDGDAIVTDYSVAVEASLKGPAVREITVSILGGRVAFEDGTTATLISTMRAPVNGERYVLFLGPTFYAVTPAQRQAAKGPIYTPSHLALGVFELDSDLRIQPKAAPRHPLRHAYGGMAESEFIAVIKRTVVRTESVRRNRHDRYPLRSATGTVAAKNSLRSLLCDELGPVQRLWEIAPPSPE
jgi:hypothetical protein